MGINTVTTSRKQALHHAISDTLTQVFDAPPVRNLLSQDDPSDTSDTQVGSKIVAHFAQVMQRCVQMHVENWMAERGLDQAFEAVDENLLKTEVDGERALVSPCSAYAGTSFSQIRLKCKRQQLQQLKEQLQLDKERVENVRAQVTSMVENASSLNSKLSQVDTNTPDRAQFSQALQS